MAFELSRCRLIVRWYTVMLLLAIAVSLGIGWLGQQLIDWLKR